MDLLFEVINPLQLGRDEPRSGIFGPAGGIIGRHPACTWCIDDPHRYMSNRHAEVRYRDGEFFLIDLSRNGIEQVGSGPLPKGGEIRVSDGDRFRLGDLEIRARLRARSSSGFSGQGAGPLITDLPAKGLTLDPLAAFETHDADYAVIDELCAFLGEKVALHQSADHTPVDHDHLVIPRLVPSAEPQAAPADSPNATQMSGPFWERLGQTLGIDFIALEPANREAVLLDAAGLLRQCILGLQRSLRNRADLERDLCQGSLPNQSTQPAPLEPKADIDDTLRGLLLPGAGRDVSEPASGQVSSQVSRQTINLAFRDLQAHQVATQAASRAVARAALEQFSPQQLNWEFERDSSRPVINTAGSRWRAYLRFHHALSHNDDWSDALLARHFAEAYQDQIRLTTTLHLDFQG